MFYSVLALLLRSLRYDVRARGAHLTRLALCAAIYVSLIYYQMLAAWIMTGSPGLEFFRSILMLNLTFLTLVGLTTFSSSIAEEKEEDSLGLLRMAGVDSLGLLLGKVGGRLMQAIALLVVQFPFTLLAITLGGVGFSQIQAAFVAMAAFLIMLAGIGVLCSTVCQTTRAASTMMVAIMAVYWIGPWMCQNWIADLNRSGRTISFRPLVEFAADCCVYMQTGRILTTGFADSLWTAQVVTNSLLGIGCFLLAWALFDVCTRNPRSEPVSRGLATRGAKGFRFSSPGRAFSNSLVWKDFHFATGGIVGLVLRTLCYVGLFFAVSIFFSQGNDWQAVLMIFLAFQAAFLPIDASMLISRALMDEVRGQTIPSLVMLPRSVPFIVYSKLAGALIGLLPGLTCFTIAFCCSGLFEKMLEMDMQLPFTLLMGGVYILLLPHLTMVIALVVRWGATPLAIAALYAIQMVESMLMLPLFILMPAGPGDSFWIYMAMTSFINMGLCIACHIEMLRRFRKLAEK
jgi:hypothetical protein